MRAILDRVQAGALRIVGGHLFEKTWFRALLLLAAVFFILIRSPRLILEGRFWAEEGSYYFYVAWYDGWAAFLQPFNGYYSFFNWIASILAVQVPLEYAPLVTSGCSALVMLIPSTIVLFAPFRVPVEGWRRCLLALLLVFPNNNHEVWVNVINSQFWLALSVSLLLLVDLRRTRTFYFGALLVVTAGLTGPVSVTLAPLFCFLAWKEKHWRHLVIATLLSLAALLQATFMFIAVSDGERSADLDIWIKGTTTLFRVFLFPFFQWYDPKRGDPAALEHLRLIYLFASLVIGSFLLRWAAATKERIGLWVFSAALFVTAVSSFGAFPAGRDAAATSYASLRYFSDGRYHLVGNGLILSLLLLPPAHTRLLGNLIASLLLVVFVSNAMRSYLDFRQTGPNWREEIAAWRDDPNSLVHIWPKGWQFRLDPKFERNPPDRSPP